MATFSYKALDNAGRPQNGQVLAESVQAAIRDLQAKGLVPISVVEGKSSGGGGVARVAKAAGVKRSKGKKIKLGVMVNFTQMLSTLVSSGSPLLDSLVLIQKQTVDDLMKETLENIIQNVRKGDSFSEALRREGAAFPTTMVSMIAAGESSGSLPLVLERYGEYIERQEQLVKRLRSMLIYPSFVVGFAVLLIGGLMFFVIPKFAQFFKESGQEMPFVTRALIGFADAMSKPIFQLGIPVVLGAAVAGIVTFFRTTRGMILWDRMKVNLPLFGPLIFRMMLARLAMTLGTLVGSGVSIVPALQAVRDVVGSYAFEQEIDRIIHKIERGGGLAETMAEGNFFPPLFIQVVRIGEEVSKLPELLGKMGTFYDREAEAASQRIMSMVEPLLIVVMGGVVGTVVLAIIMPILKSAQTGFK